MEFLLAIVIGFLYGAGVYLLLRRNTLKFILALGLLSNATHLLIFTSAGITRGDPPLIGEGESALTAPYADPLPQALILTAIVISFGLTAFMVLLIQRSHATLRTDDPEELVHTDHLGPYKPLDAPAQPADERLTQDPDRDSTTTTTTRAGHHHDLPSKAPQGKTSDSPPDLPSSPDNKTSDDPAPHDPEVA